MIVIRGIFSMSNLVRSRTVYKTPVIIAVVTMLVLLFALPFILNQVAPSLESWSGIGAWLVATGVGLTKYTLDDQAANKAKKTT
jgi:protein-S-isoprenylcysteine O-methyltransferase Ste14